MRLRTMREHTQHLVKLAEAVGFDALRTPWGVADDIQHIGGGIYRVDTPSHGGYFVPPELLPLPRRIGR